MLSAFYMQVVSVEAEWLYIASEYSSKRVFAGIEHW